MYNRGPDRRPVEVDLMLYSTSDPDRLVVAVQQENGNPQYIGEVMWVPQGWLPVGSFAFSIHRNLPHNTSWTTMEEAVQAMFLAWFSQLERRVRELRAHRYEQLFHKNIGG